MALPINNGGKTDKYTWQQTAYDITIIFPLHGNKKKDISLKFSNTNLSLRLQDKLQYEGTFLFPIKMETSTWYIEDDNIIIELDKFKKHEWWKCTFVGDEEIDTSKVVPAQESFADLDDSTKYTIDKMMYEQELKNKIAI